MKAKRTPPRDKMLREPGDSKQALLIAPKYSSSMVIAEKEEERKDDAKHTDR